MENPFLDSSPSRTNELPLPRTLKRSASLLPAFEPLSTSSPPPKRRATTAAVRTTYPTPIPTSTAGLFSSPAAEAPQRLVESPKNAGFRSPAALGSPQSSPLTSRPPRPPLSTLPRIVLPATGHELLMGRSSHACDYQFAANRLVSRVHVRARYIAPDAFQPARVEVLCCGWNGVTLHCHGRSYQLAKGDSFSSATHAADIILDVHGTRVSLVWPGPAVDPGSGLTASDASWLEDERLASPLRLGQRLISPISPTPGAIVIYEDADASAADGVEAAAAAAIPESIAAEDSALVDERFVAAAETGAAAESKSSLFSPDSVGETGQDARSPVGLSSPLSPSPVSPLSSLGDVGDENAAAPNAPLVQHVINQLAFSRLSSTPLSVIHSHLPPDLALPLRALPALLAAPCIGRIQREGKDAAGKPLETEYYYVPDADADAARRAAVVDGLQRPSLRTCRKQHKQYYWKRPRTP